MKLRYLFILTFSLIALFPIVLFWVWPYSKALDSEINDVKERHLVIAQNLAGSFSRYYHDVSGIFTIVDRELDKNEKVKTLLKSYGFSSVVLLSKSGIVSKCLYSNEKKCPSTIDSNILKLVKKTIEKDKTKISTVTEDKSINSGPILLVVKEVDESIILGYLSTKYIVEMGKKVAFGEKGHAAVVDEDGNVLAHPLDSWIEKRKNILKVSAVQKMLQGKTGVEKFYSPALKGDMIAGYTFVPNARWGVMVPQPIIELESKAKEIDEMAMYVLFLGLGMALLVSIPISFILINPLEKLSQAIKSVEKGNNEIDLTCIKSKIVPLEICQLKDSFVKMMDKIEKNKKEISTLAYIDWNTGLPNRNYFDELANRSLNNMLKSNKKGALVFIDFDGFKGVNDKYGHRAGDELLTLFAKGIMEHFSLFDEHKKAFCLDKKTLPKVLPARLGGDEFVLLFRNIDKKSELKNEIEKLFKDIFTTYELYGGVKVKLSGSAGVALFPKDGDDYHSLLKSADIAMYNAKAAGKNTIRFSKAISTD